MSNLLYHKEITDAQWNRIKFLFEERKKVGRSPHFGNWNSIYHKFRQWCAVGLFKLLLQLSNVDASEATLLEKDSTFCKVHQSACSSLKDQAIGLSRGGKNSKVHVIINEKMQLMSISLTGGNVHDSEPVIDLFAGVNLDGKTVLEERGAVVCIPDKSNFKVKHTFDAELYKQRRFFSVLRIIATSPLDTISWLSASSILFYSLHRSFTFNLPTTPKDFFCAVPVSELKSPRQSG
ncbi:MAG: hypothetical protein IKE46_02860 [Selenomonadaceae bacterium]|nr:hypothetical protein [Selenomonadaceae bacterium]